MTRVSLDAVAAASLGAAAVAEVLLAGVGGTPAVAVPTQAAVGAAVGLRSRAPMLGTVVALVAMTLDAAFAGEPGSATAAISLAVLFFACGAHAGRATRWGGLAVAAAFCVPMLLGGNGVNDVLAAVLTSMGVPWLVGALRRRQQLVRLERRRSEQLARDREEAATRAVAAERARLARELHDVVSHNVGMIIMQAGAGDVLLDEHPERARAALHAIEDGARSSLVELRRMLGLLRSDEGEPDVGAPTLAEVPELARQLRDVGVQVDLEVDPAAAEGLSPEQHLAAFRVVQEALTNVIKHSDASRVRVRIARGDGDVGVEVTDDGRATSPGGASGGFGLQGLAERMAAVGGSLSAGPGVPGGWKVRASMPCPRRT